MGWPKIKFVDDKKQEESKKEVKEPEKVNEPATMEGVEEFSNMVIAYFDKVNDKLDTLNSVLDDSVIKMQELDGRVTKIEESMITNAKDSERFNIIKKILDME